MHSPGPGEPMIGVSAIGKQFGSRTALNDVTFSVDAGRVLALLGPNGAGKTTIVRILTTLLRPDSGRASIAGYDVVRQPGKVRPLIGLAGQFAAVDELLTGRENLELIGLWNHFPKAEYRRRAQEILDRFALSDSADRRVKTYSGGMRRRLDIGASLIARPPIVFLDEPTTGLDPRTRNDLWEYIEELVSTGTTVLLTTQYMEEAEHLADDILILDTGRVIAGGSAEQLKEQIGGDTLEVRVRDASDLPRATQVLADLSGGSPRTDPDRRLVTVATASVDGTDLLLAAGRRLQDERIRLSDITLHRPSLDDVFLALTGISISAPEPETSPAAPAPAQGRQA